jgi:hypothetical protein
MGQSMGGLDGKTHFLHRADVDTFLAEMRLPGKVRATGPLERRIDEFGEAASRRVFGPP